MYPKEFFWKGGNDAVKEQMAKNVRRGKQRRRRAKKRRTVLLILFCFLLTGFILSANQNLLFDTFQKGIALFSKNDLKVQTEFQLDVTEIHSKNILLLDLETGKILGEQQAREVIYPASLTKIMTALVAVEQIEDWDEIVQISPSIYDGLYAQEASLAGFEPGEEVPIRDLLYGALLRSGAECCLTLAEKVAGGEQAFVSLMNSRAKELGMRHTHFCNTTGLHQQDHVSTVEDIAILLKNALSNDLFRQVFMTRWYQTESTEIHPDGLIFTSSVFELMETAGIYEPAITGGKTGYTQEAGLCLASLAHIEDKEYILVTAKANGTPMETPYHVWDAVSIYRQLSEWLSIF